MQFLKNIWYGIQRWFLVGKITRWGAYRDKMSNKVAELNVKISNVNSELFKAIAEKGGDSIECRAIKSRLKIATLDLERSQHELQRVTAMTNGYIAALKQIKEKIK